MSISKWLFVVLLSICVLIRSVQADPPCPNQCRFTFCPVQGNIELGPADEPRTYPICSRNGLTHVGKVSVTGEAYLFDGTSYLRISEYKPYGLQAQFSPTFWKSYSFARKYAGKVIEFSGVGHEKLRMNQADFLHGKCYILPLKQYQVLDAPFGNGIGLVKGESNFSDCVSFYVS